MADLNPYAAPSAPVADVRSASGIELAERSTRLGATIIDSTLVGGIALAGMAVGLAIHGTESGVYRVNLRYLYAFLGVAPLAAYNVLLLYRYGQTIGKRLLHIKIVRRDGSRATLWRLLVLRTLVTWFFQVLPFVGSLFLLVDALFIFGEPRRCVHDYIADTLVVKL